MLRRIVFLIVGLLCLVTTAPHARAHPHVWVTMTSELLYAPDGTITGVRLAWTFDDMFSAFATQGLEQKTKGQFTREELAPLAKVNVESLQEYAYFTYVKVNGERRSRRRRRPSRSIWKSTIPNFLSTSASPRRIRCGSSMHRRNVRCRS